MILAYSCDPCPQSMNSNACVREIEFKLSISLTSHPSRSAYSYIMRVAAMPRSHLPQRHESGAHPLPWQLLPLAATSSMSDPLRAKGTLTPPLSLSAIVPALM